jgi:S-adenosylmethionine:tRNA ribosyltransferase-isomerase
VVEELQISQFDYDLPKHLIAQEPCPQRDGARLLVLRRADGAICHHHIRDLPTLLKAGDLLVLNNTKVLPARLRGNREATGGKWEGLFLRADANGLWELLSQTRGWLESGEWIAIDSGALRLRLVAKTEEGHWFAQPSESGSPEELLQRYGEMPLPPYIRNGHAEPADRERYQTVFAGRSGSIAAPTAGLHFTPELLNQLADCGIPQAYVTLHVGLGTFQPMQVENVADHRMHSEWCELPAATAEAMQACRQRGGRIVAVGTTTVRVLETAARSGAAKSWSGETDLFIRPPFSFRAVNALLTNFHLPRSSLLVLVSAFAGIELIRQAYQAAIAEGYRFYSYGDAMLIL